MAWIKVHLEGKVFPFYESASSDLQKNQRKLFGFSCGDFCHVYGERDYAYWLALDKQSLEAFGKRLIERALAEPNFFQNLKTGYAYSRKTLIKVIEEVVAKDLSCCSNNELAILRQKLIKKLSDFSTYSVWVPDSVGQVLPAILREELSKTAGEEKTRSYAQLLLSPTKPSFVQEEREKLREISSLLQSDPESAKEKLEEHARGYWWIDCTYAKFVKLNAEDFKKRAEEFGERCTESPSGESSCSESVYDKLARVAREKKAVLKELGSNKIIFLTNLAEEFTQMHDGRKSALIQAAYAYNLILQKVAKRFSLGKEAYFMFSKEIQTALEKGVAPAKKALEARKKYAVIYRLQGPEFHFGDDAVSVKQKIFGTIEESKELKGTPASPGVVRGIVRVLTSINEASKFKEGEVLVASNTTPDYVIVMKKAKAILTERGGITSHAALVSRELGVPCVVGVEDCTRLLKDGDLVEVDATNGIVRKLA